MFHGGGHNTRLLVTRKLSERYNPKCVLLSPKRAVQIHVWGFISKFGMGPIRLINGNLNAIKYQEQVIFDIQQISHSEPGHPRRALIFQQDNAPAHAARSTRDFLANQGVSTLDWPGNSPDFNPIEHVWAHMARRIRARGLPANTQELWQWVQEEWWATPITLIRSLYDSLPSRLSEAAANMGAQTHY